MRFGIDFGTTRVVVAACDRGNYPAVHFEDRHGDSHDFAPSLVTYSGGQLVAGWAAADDPLAVASIKRVLGTGVREVNVSGRMTDVKDIVGVQADMVARRLREYARFMGESTEIEAIVGVPATATSAQRLITLDAFSRAGINVLGLMAEPSAAAYEFTHRHPRTLNSKRRSVIVYDLGGGTFDASLVTIDALAHRVIATVGIPRLGGDDFDEILVELALKAAGMEDSAMGATSLRRLTNEVRSAKEGLVPQTKRMIIDVVGTDAIVTTAEFYEACAPLITKTLDAMEPLTGQSLRDTDVAGIYLVGGATNLPAVPRKLREKFGHRVHRSPLPGASTAVGLAIAADPTSGYSLHDRLSRGIGVFREQNDGSGVSFDHLITPDTPVDDDGGYTVTRSYPARHNVGWFRYVEYTDTDMATLATVIVPFDPLIADDADLEHLPVERREDGPWVEETIHLDSDGITTVTISVEGRKPITATSEHA